MSEVDRMGIPERIYVVIGDNAWIGNAWATRDDAHEEAVQADDWRVVEYEPAASRGAVASDDAGWALNDAIIDALRTSEGAVLVARAWEAVSEFQRARHHQRGAVAQERVDALDLSEEDVRRALDEERQSDA